jgi:hypothetical protein
MNEELSGWKLAVSDVFRSEPDCSKLLCVMVGDRWCSNYRDGGSYYCLFSGFMLPASIGMPLTGMILLYLFPGIVVGYVAKCLWRTIEGASN